VEISVFEKPTKENFVHMLESLVEETQSIAARKAAEVQAKLETTVNPSAGYTQALSQSLLPVHKDRVVRAMDLIVSVVRRAGLSFDDLCTTAREFLKNHTETIARLVIRAPYVSFNPSTQGGLIASFREPFIRQIDDGLQDLRIGYIGQRNVAMPAAETVQAKALRMLQVIYDRTKSSEEPVDTDRIAAELGLNQSDGRAAWAYLKDKNLIRTFSLPYTARINAPGVDAIEAAQLKPDETTRIFPSVTYNFIIHGTGAGSQVNVATAGSSQVLKVSQTDPAVLQQLIEGVRQLVEQATQSLPIVKMPPDEQQATTAALAELKAAGEAQSPDVGRLRSSLDSLKHVMEHAAGHVIGAGILTNIDKLVAIANVIGGG
jgi:hypothetical protein